MEKNIRRFLRLTVLVGFILLTGKGTAQADPFMNTYFKAMKNHKSAEYVIIGFHLEAMGNGMQWANKVLEVKGENQIYCQPKDIYLNAKNYMYIINQYLDENPSVKKTAEGSTVGRIQILSLIDAFPCTEPVPEK